MMKMINFQLMMLMMLSFLNLFISIFPVQNKLIHPMILGLILLMNLIFCCLNIELYIHINWISYLIFLIIIGGLMIIFLYFTSFISNMKMSMKWEFIKLLLIKFNMMFFFILFLLYNLKFNFSWYMNSLEINEIKYMYNFKINTMYMYMYNKNYSMNLCLIYLLIVLMFIVKICINNKMSLRKLN